MARSPIIDAEVSAGAPIDETLTKTKIKANDDDHESRILALEALSIQPGESDEADQFADILTDKAWFTDSPLYFRHRFHPIDHKLDGSTPEKGFINGFNLGTDLEDNQKDVRWAFQFEDKAYSSAFGTTNYWKQYAIIIEKDERIWFRLKRGENFFGIMTALLNASRSDQVAIYIDGQTPSALGLLDQNGNAAVDSFTSNTTNQVYQRMTYFFGLDSSKDHWIELHNNDSASKDYYLNGFEVGYKPVDFTIDHNITVRGGKALVKGINTDIPAGTYAVAPSTGYGHTAILAAESSTGNTRIINGIEPAMTVLKADQSIDFDTVITQLLVKNANNFPIKGICLFQHPLGGNFYFSYDSKTTASVQAHSLNNIIWKHQPIKTLETPTTIVSLGTNPTSGKFDSVINLWADPQMQINSSNNKLDFEITVKNPAGGAGITTSHTATIPSGWYDDELVPLGAAIEQALEAVKPIKTDNGKYIARFNRTVKLWQVGADGPSIVSINLLWNSGANIASSIGPTLGFSASTDLEDEIQYFGTSQVNAKSRRVLYPDRIARTGVSQEIKYSTTGISNAQDYQYLVRKFGFYWRAINTTDQCTINIYPDEDVIGVIVLLATRTNGFEVGIHATIDDREEIWFKQTNEISTEADNTIGRLYQAKVLTFPRGSQKIAISDKRMVSMQRFPGLRSSSSINFLGYIPLYSRPLTEELTDDEQILHTYDVAPVNLFETIYAHNGGVLHSPGNVNPAFSQINTITESGSWAPITSSAFFNAWVRRTNGVGDYVDVNFTLNKDGGGIYLAAYQSTDGTIAEFYLSQSAINESTDLMHVSSQYSTTSRNNSFRTNSGMLGLKAGTYNARFKKSETTAGQYLYNAGIVIIDGEIAQENAYTTEDISNVGQSVSRCVTGKKIACVTHSLDRIYDRLRNGYAKQSFPTDWHYSINTDGDTSFNREFLVTIEREAAYYGAWMPLGAIGEYGEYMGIAMSLTAKCPTGTGRSNNNVVFVDGRQAPNVTNFREQVKNGSATADDILSLQKAFKEFSSTCSMSSKTVSLTDTRGLRLGQRITLVNNVGDTEKAYIASIVTDTSFDVQTPLVNITDTDVVKVIYGGFHTMRIRTDAASGGVGSFEVTLPPLMPSNYKKRVVVESNEEVVTKVDVSPTAMADLPYFSDGTEAKFNEINIDILAAPSATAMNLLDWPFVSASGWILKYTAKRNVKDNSGNYDWEW